MNGLRDFLRGIVNKSGASTRYTSNVAGFRIFVGIVIFSIILLFCGRLVGDNPVILCGVSLLFLSLARWLYAHISWVSNELNIAAISVICLTLALIILQYPVFEPRIESLTVSSSQGYLNRTGSYLIQDLSIRTYRPLLDIPPLNIFVDNCTRIDFSLMAWENPRLINMAILQERDGSKICVKRGFGFTSFLGTIRTLNDYDLSFGIEPSDSLLHLYTNANYTLKNRAQGLMLFHIYRVENRKAFPIRLENYSVRYDISNMTIVLPAQEITEKSIVVIQPNKNFNFSKNEVNERTESIFLWNYTFNESFNNENSTNCKLNSFKMQSNDMRISSDGNCSFDTINKTDKKMILSCALLGWIGPNNSTDIYLTYPHSECIDEYNPTVITKVI